MDYEDSESGTPNNVQSSSTYMDETAQEVSKFTTIENKIRDLIENDSEIQNEIEYMINSRLRNKVESALSHMLATQLDSRMEEVMSRVLGERIQVALEDHLENTLEIRIQDHLDQKLERILEKSLQDHVDRMVDRTITSKLSTLQSKINDAQAVESKLESLTTKLESYLTIEDENSLGISQSKRKKATSWSFAPNAPISNHNTPLSHSNNVPTSTTSSHIIFNPPSFTIYYLR